MAKDPVDTEVIWTNKHCNLKLGSLCQKNQEKCSGIRSTELAVFRYVFIAKTCRARAHFVFDSFSFGGQWSNFSRPDGEFQHRWISPAVLNHSLGNRCRVQNQNPVNVLICKNSYSSRKQKKWKCFTFPLYLHSTYTEKWQILRMCTCVCAHPPAHTYSFTHTHARAQMLSSFTQNSDMTHCRRGGILPVFWFLSFKMWTLFFSFLLWGGKRVTQNWNDDDAAATEFQLLSDDVDKMQAAWGPWSQSRQLGEKINNISNGQKRDMASHWLIKPSLSLCRGTFLLLNWLKIKTNLFNSYLFNSGNCSTVTVKQKCLHD